jgi:hypothetical protein
MNANATTPSIITINPNRELRKDQWKEMALQQQSHIGLLMKRLEMEKDMYSSMFHEKLEQEKELEALKEATCDYEYLKESHLTKKQLEDLQSEAARKATEKALEWCSGQIDALRAELAEIKEGKFDCDVYWSAMNGEITIYKIPNDVACLNTTDGDNAVLDAFQNGYFGEEWGSYSKLEVVEMTREMLEEHIGELVEREEEPESEIDLDGDEYDAECSKCGAPGTWLEGAIKKNVQLCPECADEEDEAEERKKETERPKSHKDIAIDELNEFLSQTSTTLRMTYDEELVRTEEPPAPAAPAFEPLHKDATHQVVRGFFGVEFVWKVPAGINLRDTDTYEFGDKWGTLYISNKITGEEFEIDDKDEEDDFKRAHTLEVEDRDDDDNTC